MGIQEDSLKLHERLKGKLEVRSKVRLVTKRDFSLAYTPGVAEPCRKIFANREDVYKYTIKGNCIAVVSNGTAVLGLGNIGAHAAIPVMEGKAAIFKEMAGIDAFPICIDSEDVQKNIEIIRAIAPVFGGINLEDYKAPECFEIEAALQDIGIPVMHDDQHGTAIVVLAALINSLKVAGKKTGEVRIVISGAGAAGTAVAKLLVKYGADGRRMVLCDTKGVIHSGRGDLKENRFKQELAAMTNGSKFSGSLADAMRGADVFIGVSKKGLVSRAMVRSMAPKAIVFAMANPEPEIMPDEARAAGALVVATGRSDFPNQINNALAFPGVFRGALDARATRITEKMKVAAAEALAGMVKPSPGAILPPITERETVKKVSEAVAAAWKRT